MNPKHAAMSRPSHPHGPYGGPRYVWGRPASMYLRALRTAKPPTT